MKNYIHILLLFWSSTIIAQTKGFTTLPTGAERRFALVIGNKDYSSIGSLRNPINDANDVSKAFRDLGFEVTTITNTDYKRMIGAFNQFTKNLLPTDVVVFYYSGHGISYDGKNYLIPTDATISCVEEIEANAHSLGRLLTAIEVKNVKNTFVFLDACRNIPNIKKCNVTTKDVSISKGLVRPANNPAGSMIIYATREGDTADDNATERNGLFTSEFLKYITVPNLGLRQILDRTKKGVENRSNKRQSPARYDELSDDFVFVVSNKTPNSNTIPTEPQPNIQPQPTSNTQPQNGEIKDLPFGPSMVFVKGGTFEMGSNRGYINNIYAPGNEMLKGKTHNVSVSDFWMAQTEVSVEQYLAFCEATSGHYPEWLESGSKSHVETGYYHYKYKDIGYSRTSETLPISGISWDDAIAYCKWLTKKTGLKYRLPTEAEWEFAARGGTESNNKVYAGSNNANAVGWNKSNSNKKPHSIKQNQSNELGLYDMSGNVSEWCNDWYGDYTADAQQNPTGVDMGSNRVLRGGNWDDSPQNSRVASRDSNTFDYRNNNVGFRVVFSQ
jgi:formylglycine-generating enzyme required for sulfatase activity